MTAPLDGYEPRSWTTYVLTPEEGMEIPSELVPELRDLISDSAETEALANLDTWDVKDVFYTDFEQVAAGHDKHGAGPLFKLSEEYRGHEAGKLGFVSYEGMGEAPPTYTLYLEN